MTTSADERTSTPQPAPIVAADRAIKPPLSGKPVDQLVVCGGFRARLAGDLAKVTELRVRLDAKIAVSEQSGESKGLDYEFHAGPHSNLREGVVTLDRCRLSLGPDLLDQGACVEAGWAGVFRPLGGMPPIRTIRISPGRPKLLATPPSFGTTPFTLMHALEEGATPTKGIEYLILLSPQAKVKLDLLLLDSRGNIHSTFTLKSGSPLRLDRARDALDPAPTPPEPWALDAMARACRQADEFCT